ncbi:hypothetical protein JGU66_16855 [Myxococcaceae bacterium JPH2]|nr:hypothetical protein [Myxococcaceae bacterium JPH2]
MRNILAIIVTLATLGAVPALAGAPVEAGKVYVGSEGAAVTVVPLTPREGKKYLVRVEGTGSEFDGLVLPATVNDWSSSSSVRMNYVTQYHGRDYAVVVVSGSSTELYVPGRRSNGIGVRYDAKRTESLKSDDVYSQFQKLEKAGTLAKLMAFDRKAEMTRHDGEYAEKLKAMNASCGTQVAGTLDWSSVSDDLIKEYSISGFCEAPLASLRALCDISEEARRTVKAKVKQVDCRFGASVDPKLEADRLIWTTAKDASNQEEFATRYFKQNL